MHYLTRLSAQLQSQISYLVTCASRGGCMCFRIVAFVLTLCLINFGHLDRREFSIVVSKISVFLMVESVEAIATLHPWMFPGT